MFYALERNWTIKRNINGIFCSVPIGVEFQFFVRILRMQSPPDHLNTRNFTAHSFSGSLVSMQTVLLLQIHSLFRSYGAWLLFPIPTFAILCFRAIFLYFFIRFLSLRRSIWFARARICVRARSELSVVCLISVPCDHYCSVSEWSLSLPCPIVRRATRTALIRMSSARRRRARRPCLGVRTRFHSRERCYVCHRLLDLLSFYDVSKIISCTKLPVSIFHFFASILSFHLVWIDLRATDEGR